MNLKSTFMLSHLLVRQANFSTLPLCLNYPNNISFLRAPPYLDSLHEFHFHLNETYKNFRRDQMQRIQDFRRKNNDTTHTMCMRLTRFVMVSQGTFAESQLVKVFYCHRLINVSLS